MADVRKRYVHLYSDPLNKTDRWQTNRKITEQQRKLWHALYEYITQQGGWVVSIPGLKVLRLEIPQGSSLPSKLSNLGYVPRHAGTGTRITPSANFAPVDIVEITLPGK